MLQERLTGLRGTPSSTKSVVSCCIPRNLGNNTWWYRLCSWKIELVSLRKTKGMGPRKFSNRRYSKLLCLAFFVSSVFRDLRWLSCSVVQILSYLRGRSRTHQRSDSLNHVLAEGPTEGGKKACRGYGSWYSPEETISQEFTTSQIEKILPNSFRVQDIRRTTEAQK